MKTSKASLLFIIFSMFTSFTVINNSLNNPYKDNSFPLIDDLVYCTPTVTPWDNWIYEFTLGNINNVFLPGDYIAKNERDFTSLSTDLETGQAYPITIKFRAKEWGPDFLDARIRVWVDKNGDGDYQGNEIVLQATEQVSFGENEYTINGNVTIPTDANLGTTGLRVFLSRSEYANPCQSLAGEYEDYTVNIIQGNNNGDTTPPTATLTTPSDPVSGPFVVTLSFNEDITGLESTDFDIDNMATISNLMGVGDLFTFTVNPTSEGQITIILPADQVRDAAGNGNTTSNTLSVTYNSNTPPPTGGGVWSLNGTNIYYDTGIVGINMNATAYDADYKLMVNGDVKARRVKVSPDGWADFVFADDYELPTLKSVEEFISKNKHLPEMPSEREVLEQGVYLDDMDSKLLQKIEELTLYIIELEKRIAKMENE